MPLVLDQQLSRDWYRRLPHAFRDLDTSEQLLRYLRSLGDYAGGLALIVQVLEGKGYIRPITLSNDSQIVVGQPVLVIDAVIDPATGGAVIPLDPPVTSLDPFDEDVLVLVSGDWVLQDVASIPGDWLPWIAQCLSVRLDGVPAGEWRPWITSPTSRLTGSLAAIQEAASWHLLETVPFTVARASQWEVTVDCQDEAITTTLTELQAAVDAVAPAGVAVTVNAT